MKPGSLKLIAALAAFTLTAFAGCKATVVYPDPLPGWHDSSFSSVFGRLQRVAAKKEGEAPVWIIRFGLAGDQYQGEFALTPQEKLIGFSGGEQVEIHGAVRPDLADPRYAGSIYEIQSIRMWRTYR